MVTDDSPTGSSVVGRVVHEALADRRRSTADDIERFLDAAVAELVARSPHSPRVGDIARRAGMSTQTFYRYFRTKEDALAAVQERISEQSERYLRRLMARQPGPTEQVEAWVRGMLTWLTAPGPARVARPVLVEVSRVAPERIVSGGPGDFETPVRRLLLDPLERAGSADPERDAHAIADLVFGMSRRCLWLDRSPSEADVDHVIAFCVARSTATAGAHP